MDRLPVKAQEPTWRKPAGIALILLLIVAWAALVATVADRLPALPWPLEALFYIAAGITWMLPLKPLLRWIETGRWRS
jgi:hypothetical protein